MRVAAAITAAVAAGAFIAALSGASLPLPRLGRRLPTLGWILDIRRDGTPVARVLGTSLTVAGGTLLVVSGVTRSLPIAAVPAVIVALLPVYFVRSRVARRDRERLAAWPDAIRSLVSALRSGHSVHEGLCELSRSGPPALRDVWVRYRRLTEHGLPEARALEAVRQDLADPLADRVCEVLILAGTKGSKIALRVLRELADATAADVQLHERLLTAGVEQRLNARAVFVLPWLTLVLLASRPGLYREFYTSAAGTQVLIIGAAMSVLGLLAVRRLARLPGEPRILLDSNQPHQDDT